MNADKEQVAVKKIRDRGKPGSPGHAVELEVTVSRRKAFRILVPFLVASFALGAQNETASQHEVAADHK